MAHHDFYDWTGPRPLIEVNGRKNLSPIYYNHTEGFWAVFPASFDAVAEILPAEALQPSRWLDGRALVIVAAMRYRDVTVLSVDGSTDNLAPYGEILVGAFVGYRRSPRVNPFGAQSAFVLHLPVTTREACEGGRSIWGFPKFVADMDFVEDEHTRAVTLGEGGADIFTLRVHPRGPVLHDRAPLTAYTSLRGDLVETRMPMSAHGSIRPGGGQLLLGEHPVAESLRALDVRPKPLFTGSYLDQRMILPVGRPVGPAGPYEGYRGADRAVGRYTIAYPTAAPVDQYASLVGAGG